VKKPFKYVKICKNRKNGQKFSFFRRKIKTSNFFLKKREKIWRENKKFIPLQTKSSGIQILL